MLKRSETKRFTVVPAVVPLITEYSESSLLVTS